MSYKDNIDNFRQYYIENILYIDIQNVRNNNGNNNNNNINNNNNNNHKVKNNHETKSIWVFGYGSLCWYPGFTYSKCITGYIRGYTRKFWQGNTTHRGTVEKPGRVATLVEDKEGLTWGCAYKITGETALKYLEQRECTLGGYVTIEAKFFPRKAAAHSEINGHALSVLVYIATEKNSLWLGESSVNEIAKQIAESNGPSGHNAEYLLRLATFMREEIPGVDDDHLFSLEKQVKEILLARNIPLASVMGVTPRRIRRDSHEEIKRPITFEFIKRAPERKLRCLNI